MVSNSSNILGVKVAIRSTTFFFVPVSENKLFVVLKNSLYWGKYKRLYNGCFVKSLSSNIILNESCNRFGKSSTILLIFDAPLDGNIVYLLSVDLNLELSTNDVAVNPLLVAGLSKRYFVIPLVITPLYSELALTAVALVFVKPDGL